MIFNNERKISWNNEKVLMNRKGEEKLKKKVCFFCSNTPGAKEEQRTLEKEKNIVQFWKRKKNVWCNYEKIKKERKNYVMKRKKS